MSDERHSRGTKDLSGTPLLVAGLGNPGSQYARNRHNAGFIVVDALHAEYGFGPWKAKFEGLLSEGSLGGRKTYLLKPQTYMNLSGDSVGPALRFFKLPLNALVVLHDEIDLAAGKIKVKTGGRDAGAGLPPGAHRRRPSRRQIAGERPCAAEFLRRGHRLAEAAGRRHGGN